jgi:hypothetical protein
MNILVLSGYDDAMAPIGDRCTPTHKAYAERHGYAHEVVREYLATSHPSHQKIRLLKERIDKFDAILWLDADTVVTNMDAMAVHEHRESLDLGPFLKHVMDISIDWCAPPEDDDFGASRTTYVSCGNFILWNTPDTARFIAEWEAASLPYATRNLCCWEQDGLRAAMAASKWFNDRVYRWPRRKFNAVHPTCVNRNFPNGAPKPWEPGDFLLHLTNVDRAAILDTLGL